MTATVKGVVVNGTPEEIAKLIELVNMRIVTTYPSMPSMPWYNTPNVVYGEVHHLNKEQTKNFMKNIGKAKGNINYV